MRGTSFPVQQTRHTGPFGAVERHSGDTGHVFIHPLEGGHMASSLEHELSLVAFDVDPIQQRDRRDLALGNLDLRTKGLSRADLRDVAHGVFPLAGDGKTAAKARQRAKGDDHFPQGPVSSFDFDGHHAENSRARQAPRAPRSPYDWSLDDPGKAYHIDPVTTVIPPDLDPHVRAPIIPLSASRAPRMEVMRSSMLAYAAIGFLFAISAAAFYGAAVRMPEVRQASVDAEGV
jgi:hypothetical protein